MRQGICRILAEVQWGLGTLPRKELPIASFSIWWGRLISESGWGESPEFRECARLDLQLDDKVLLCLLLPKWQAMRQNCCAPLPHVGALPVPRPLSPGFSFCSSLQYLPAVHHLRGWSVMVVISTHALLPQSGESQANRLGFVAVFIWNHFNVFKFILGRKSFVILSHWEKQLQAEVMHWNLNNTCWNKLEEIATIPSISSWSPFWFLLVQQRDMI